jgi:prophage tail gpP-like protein
MVLVEGGKQDDQVILYLTDSGLTLDRFVSYSFDSNFLEPTDAFHLVTGGKENPSLELVEALVPGAEVKLYVNGTPQAVGYIDDVTFDASPHGGRTMTITGRDVFAPVVSAGADPYKLKFQPTQTVADFVEKIFGQFGFTNFDDDDAADRSIKTGLNKARYSKKKGKPLKKFALAQQLKPNPGEGTWQYVDRVVTRSGLYVWPSADGTTVICSTPDYDQVPVAHLVRHIGDNVSNIESGGVACKTVHQPSIIVATGFSGGGEWSRAHHKVLMVNELVGFDNSKFGTVPYQDPYNRTGLSSGAYVYVNRDVIQVIQDNLDGYLIPARFTTFPDAFARPQKRAKPIFMHDEESRSLEQLINFVQRKMSQCQKDMYIGTYTVKGHTFDDGQGNKIPWTVNTMVGVEDEDTKFNGTSFSNPMWVMGRTFVKSRAGTFTHLHLILPHTLEFFELNPEAA